MRGGVSGSSSTRGRVHRRVRSPLAYVQKEGSYILGRRRSGPGRGRIRAVVVGGVTRGAWGCHGGGCGVSPLLACRVEARRVHVTADVRVERPERRGSDACRETWGCRGRGSGGSAVAAAGAVAWGRHWGGRGVLPLACHGGTRRGRASAGVRIERSGRRGSIARRETHERRGRAWGAVPPLLPALSPCARVGPRAHGSSPRGARGADAVADRAALGGTACAGRASRVARGDAGRAGLSATDAVSLAERREDTGVRARWAAPSLLPA